jgi:hypothetical protein
MKINAKAEPVSRSEIGELLKHGRFHLIYVPTLLFISLSACSVIFGLMHNSVHSMLSGMLISLLVSQIYWGRMSVLWRMRAYQANYCFTLFREAMREQMIYPANHFMNYFLIGPKSRLRLIRNVDEHIIEKKRMPGYQYLQNSLRKAG